MAYLLQLLLKDSAARASRRSAVAVGERFLTYAELDRLSNLVAHALLAQGVAPGDRVGILAPKSAAAVVAVYGVLKTGACYVPLDPKSPAGRLAAIVPWDAVLAGPSEVPGADPAIDTDLAYILYTSGSTGAPKGVPARATSTGTGPPRPTCAPGTRSRPAPREEVLDHCRRRLPGYMVPDVVEFREALPRTSTGKVDRVRLAEYGR